jgi:ethanolaminephosphotransferase
MAYYLFDLMDGKHARNTKNSSALGLLMDHGCDALTTFLFLMSFGNIIRIGIIN